MAKAQDPIPDRAINPRHCDACPIARASGGCFGRLWVSGRLTAAVKTSHLVSLFSCTRKLRIHILPSKAYSRGKTEQEQRRHTLKVSAELYYWATHFCFELIKTSKQCICTPPKLPSAHRAFNSSKLCSSLSHLGARPSKQHTVSNGVLPCFPESAEPTKSYLVLHYWVQSTQVLSELGQADFQQGCSTDLNMQVNWMHPAGRLLHHSCITPVKTWTFS